MCKQIRLQRIGSVRWRGGKKEEKYIFKGERQRSRCIGEIVSNLEQCRFADESKKKLESVAQASADFGTSMFDRCSSYHFLQCLKQCSEVYPQQAKFLLPVTTSCRFYIEQFLFIQKGRKKQKTGISVNLGLSKKTYIFSKDVPIFFTFFYF